MAVRPIVLAGIALALAACSPRPPAKAPAAPAAVTAASAPATANAPTVVYACDNGEVLRASYPDGRTAVVDYRGRTRILTAAPTAEGARYAGEGLQWWTRGPTNAAVSALGVGETMASGGAVQCTAQGQGPAAAGAPLSPPTPGQPGGLPDDRTPVVEAPAAPQSPQAAAQVAETYFAFIEAGNYAAARKLWGDAGRASGKSPAAFAADFARYSEYHANIGAPGPAEGAAGTVYVEVPVQVYGRLKSGEAVTRIGHIALRRANDVPGSTADQRQWRIASLDLKPAPGR